MAYYDFQEKRGAIIIGIDEYPNLPPQKQLEGAVHDATELFEILKENGGFDPDIVLLKNDNATCDNIRNAIYEILFKEDNPCNQVIFYFSGHGFLDTFRTAFIAPYDFQPKKPYFRGIPMYELRNLFAGFHSSSTTINKKIICTFLDCCHSGDLMKQGKSLDMDLENFGEHTAKTLSGTGSIGLVSMDVEGTAREKEYKHSSTGEQHKHGIFTYHLLECLKGKDTDKGIITYSDLVRGIAKNMSKETQQIKQLVEAEGNIIDFEISVTPLNIKNYLTKLLTGCSTNQESIISLFDSAKNIKEIERFLSFYNEQKEYIENCKANIYNCLSNHSKNVLEWIDANLTSDRDNREKIQSIKDINLYNQLWLLPSTKLASFDEFATMDRFTLCLLNSLDIVINNKTATVDSLIKSCEGCVRLHFSSSSGSTALGVRQLDIGNRQ